MTELVSRVLYAMRSNHLSLPNVTAWFKPFGFATMRIWTGSPPKLIGSQGVASDRVYSEPMLP